MQRFENQEEFTKSVSETSTPASLKTSILANEETIMSFKQKPAEYSKSSKMFVKIFGEQDFVRKYDKQKRTQKNKR